MVYRVVADTTMALHFGFLLYVVFGGFLAWRWPRAIVAHLIAVAWGVLIVAYPVPCPLTYVEDYFRRRAGEQGLDRGFIDTYIEGVIYPEQYLNHARLLAAAVVAISWVGAYLRRRVTA